MAESLNKLAEALFLNPKPSPTSPSSGDDLLHKLRSDDAIGLGLNAFYSILKRGLEVVGDGTLQLQSWNDSQIQAIYSFAYAIASATRSLSVEQAEGLLVAVVQQSIEFALCYLEKSEFDGDDLVNQNNMIHLLEIALVDGVDMLQPTTASALVDMLPVVDEYCGNFVDDHKKCYVEGFGCSKEGKSMDWLLKTLASEHIQHDGQESGFSDPTFHEHLNNFVFLSRHWAFVHGKCTPLLIFLCNKLTKVKDVFDERAVGQSFQRRLSFTLRILKLLRSLMKNVPFVEYDVSLVRAVASFVDTLSNLFRIEFEFVNSYAVFEGSFETIILMVMEEFIHNVQVIFSNSCVAQNIQTSIIASIIGSLDSSVWRYEKSAPNFKVPLAYFPRFVLYTLKLINDLRRQRNRVLLEWRDLATEFVGGSTDSQIDSPSCLVHLESVILLKRHTFEELLKLIFPASSQWIDNLIQLALFLHSEGLKLKPKLERSYSNFAKVSGTSEVENAACHEDEALFGDLFSETGRSVGSTDGCEQPPAAAVVPSPSYHNMPIQAATELLNFLKTCIFTPEWQPSLYVEGCNKLGRTDIDILLSLLNCLGCCSEYNTFDNCASSHEDRKIGHIHEICFDLLHSLLTNHALNDSLEDYLVDKILIVENGSFSYNVRTLTLLAHILFCRVGPSGSQLRTKVYRGYVAFVVKKVKTICVKCPSFNDLVHTLPLPFHIEIVLMAFHLSAEGEKAMMANLIFSSLEEVANPVLDMNNTQLTCWALLVSRLILVLRHMIFYQQTCPTSLLLDVRSKLREVPLSGLSTPNKVNDHLSSWSTIALKNVIGRLAQEVVFNGLIDQLIDFSMSSASLGRDDLAIDRLNLNWKDIYSTFSLVMGIWGGKKATAVEDLIVERYVFTLCWDIPYIGSDADHPIKSWSQEHSVDLFNMLHYFHFSHSLLDHPEVFEKFTTFPDIVLSLLQQLIALSLPEDIEELSWDFLRNGMWLSLVLSFTNIGIWKYCMDNAISGHGLICTENSFGDQTYVKLAGSMISSIINSGQFAFLVRLFSSLLNKYVQVHQKAFLSTLNYKQKLAPGFSSLLLLKHTGINKCLQDEILEKSGCNASQLDSVLSLISTVDAAVDKKASGIPSRASWESLLHGFPFHLSTASGTLLSCILSIRGIIFVLDGLFRIKEAGGNIDLEIDVLAQIFNAAMIVKFDRTFEDVHEKYDTIYQSLSAELEWSNYTNLVLLNQMEGFLKDINSGGVSDGCVHEWIICRIIEILSSLRQDPSNRVIFHIYLGFENVPGQINRLLQLHHGDCLVLIDSLDTCYSESVNVKILGFFLDLLSGEPSPDLRIRIQRKFLEKDIHCLSKWLEKRLLGSIMDSDNGVNCVKGSSISLRESTMDFILCLLMSPSEQQSKELQQHIFNSALLLLDTAFLLFDLHVAKSYLNFIVQIARGESLMKQLLMRTVMLMEKLGGNENLLPGLKFLFGFMETVLSDCGAGKVSSQRTTKKCSSGNSLGVGHVASQPVGPKKNSETFILSANQGGPASPERDATSVDEDEDDATSDGEVVSIDKDDEDDTNSERALASKVCTFTSSGSNFMEQHWYFCYTCGLIVSKGCCSVCAKVCHRGHRVVYSRSSRFFCDCGAGGGRGSNCQCLKPRKFTGSSNTPVHGSNIFHSFLPFSEDGDQLPDSDSDFEEDFSTDGDNTPRLSIPKELQDGIPVLLEELDLESLVLSLCSSLMPSIISRRYCHHCKDKKICLGEDKVISHGVDILHLKKAYKSGSLDLKIKVDYSNARELKSHLASGSLMKSLLSVSVHGRLAVGEGDKVAIFDVGQLIGQATTAPVTADKTNVKPVSKNVVRFEIVQLAFNPVIDNYLFVAGYEDCQVLAVNPRGEVIDRLAIELALQGAYIRQVDWVPGSQVQLMVVTNRFIKIYDLSLDNISPMHYFTLPDDMIVDAALYLSSQGRMFLLVLSENGNVFRLELAVRGNVGAMPLKEVIQLQGKEIHAKGSSLYFSSNYKLLFISFQDGSTLIGRLSSDAASLVEMSSVYEEQDSKLRPAGLHHWKELLAGSGLFVCLSTVKSNSALAVSMGEHEILAQSMRHSVGSASPIVGVTAYKPLSKDRIHFLVLHDDGSLQIYSHAPVGVDAGVIAASEKVKKLGSGILNKAYAGTNAEFPLDFFEKTVCITSDVKLGGDAIRNGDSEGAKRILVNEDGFLESPSPGGFKVSVFNSNPDVVMVGFRVHVGNTSASHIPSSISIFQRVIKLDEEMRSWYDIPFTIAESLLSDEEFTITVGPTFNGSTLPRIDSLEVYGRAKDEFGWKEKMDAILDMEATVLGSNLSLPGSGKKCRSMQSASIQEQVIADGLKLITKFYSSCRQQYGSWLEVSSVELGNLKCRQLLETIFESYREPLLQASACHVLQSLFPKKEIYHQVKDTMRLLGVVKSSSKLSSRLGTGGNAGSLIIEEFTAQMRAVCKIALQRRSNFATFLETNGSEVVDALMQVLWAILDFEQPDIQTMNNIVMSAVELTYCYAECLALHGKDTGVHSVAPAVILLRKLIFSSNEAVQTASSLAISSRLLQVPFPKQTMLATDDAVESVVSVPVPSDTSGGNNQVLIEDDAITSSVQYCCDSCSTVPILRRRWHCTVCPDFDLCEACYELQDADRLPPPHSRGHPMTAIPIEVDSSGDSNEFHFTPDDVSDPNLLPVPADSSMKASSPSIHVLEPSVSGEFAASLTDPVSISDSKRVINNLLLSELVEQLKGWMHTTSGIQAIPVMQLFYRLSSAVGGPFIDKSKPDNLDLEKLINWFLDEINLSRPFVARNRSSFGEVAILVFMFLTLMLRNWHQPGSDGSMPRQSGTADIHDKNVIQFPPSTSATAKTTAEDQEKNDFASQLLRACDSLRQQSFVNYLMDILQQLVHVFKSPVNNDGAHGNAGPGCGALLTVRRDLPAGNFSPFFSDSYAKAHRADLFMDYHRLLLENVFRLVYTLVRPEKHDRTADKEKVYKISYGKDLKLDRYQDVLCSYINNPHTNFVRRFARRLFLHLCGNKSHYYSVRDSWQLSSEIKRLYKHINKSGGFQNPIPYERSVKIVKCLSAMAEVAAARPRNWQKYCLRQGDILSFLMNGIFYFGEESVIQTLKLLNFAFYSGKDVGHTSQKAESGDLSSNKSSRLSQELKKKKKGEDGAESNSEKSYLDMEAAVDVFTDKGGEILKHFMDSFLLEWNSSNVRAEAKLVLYGVWHHAKPMFKETMLMALLQKVKFLPMYGQNIVEYTELVTWLIRRFPDTSVKHQSSELVDRCLTPDVIRCIFETLRSQNELLANHPNSRIYNTLSGLVEFDGYYLESEPCVACSSPEVPYSRMKLESLKSETKFTDNRIIVKCTGSYTIQTVTMNVHDARKSKSVKVLNLYYNNRPVADLSELKNNWSLWKRAKICHLAFNQTELKVEFPIPITACNFMIELDSFYENLQALSLEPLQCPRCSRPVTGKHVICGNCHENAYQCRQCRNINYENLDSFLCNECGYSKYGRFEFNFMAKPSFIFDNMENDEDMKRGLTAIESESENAHRRYQQLLGFKKPLLKIVSSIGEIEIDSQQKDFVQQMMVSLPGPSCKINPKIALLGVLYGEKCKAAFDSVSKSVQTLQGLRKVLMNYLHQKHSDSVASRFVVSRSPNNCYGCATTFVTQCLELLEVVSRRPSSKKQLISAGILSELFENNIHQGPKSARVEARTVLCSLSEGDVNAVTELNSLIQKKVMYCLEHHRSMDIAVTTREELLLLSEVCSLADEFWESRLRVVFQLLFSSIKLGAQHPAISEHVTLPCLRIISQACTPPKPEASDKEQGLGKTLVKTKDESNQNVSSSSTSAVTFSGTKSFSESSERNWDATPRTQDIQVLSYSEWERGASYLDFVRRQYKVSQAVKGSGQRSRPQRNDYLALKYALRWKHCAGKTAKADLSVFELGSWVKELVLSACSQSIRSEMCMLISLLCAQSSSRRFRLLNLLVSLLPATLYAGESAAEYFEMLFNMIDSEDARLFLTVRGCLRTICSLITQDVSNVESLERSLHIDISQGFILHKLIELLGKFFEVANVRSRFMRDNLLSELLEALIVIRGLIVQKTKLISDCCRLLKELLDSLLLESSENKRQFIRACINGLQIHGEERKGRTCLFILEQLCNLICPSKPEPVYLLVLNKAHTQEEFIRGSMTKNPYSSAEIGPLMRDVKNKICHQLELLGLLEDDYGMELLVAGNIISLDLSIAQVYEQFWKKSNQSSNVTNSNLLSPNAMNSSRDCPPMSVTYRLQGLDGEATEPMIKELEEDREECQDPEVEFAIAGAVRECGGLEILLGMIQHLRDDFKSNQEQLVAVLSLLMYCCKIRENRRALLRLGALGLLLETAKRAFSVDAMEPAEGILLIVESLTLEANESDNISITQSALTVTNEEAGTGEQAKKIVLMFLERLSHPLGLKKSNKQQSNTEMVARILPYLTYGEPAAMEALIQHFSPYLQDWCAFDHLQRQHLDNPKDDSIAQQAAKQRFTLENFVRVSESLKTSSCGERLKDIILEKGTTQTAMRHLKESFPNAGQAGFRTSAEWTLGLALPSVPLILSMLRGLSMGHLPTQRCIDEEGILPLLHALEGVSGENEIGARAENLLDTLSNKEGKGDGFLEEKVCKLRHATRDEMRRRALQKREQLLQGLGLRRELSPDGGERIVVARPVLEGLEDVQEEEDGLACVVCREGYSLRPADLLGVYSYSKLVNLGVGASGSARGESVYTTVSYFNIIHFQCHQEAKGADAALRTPKKEWEGATLRNNESLCNSLFPIRGPSVPLTQYVRYVDKYWDNLNALGRADGSRLRLLIYDIVLMLARFATGASFSADSRGGGRESNSRFLPLMIQMARHLLDQGSTSQRLTMAKAVSAYISSSPSDPRPSSPSGTQTTFGTEETVQFMMVNSLLSESYESWLQHRRVFLQCGIYHAYMQHTHARSTSRASSASASGLNVESGSISQSATTEMGQTDELLSIVRPMLVYTGLIEQLQHFFKVKKKSTSGAASARTEGVSSSAAEGEDESGNLEGWEVVMKERLLNVKELLGFSREMLSWLDEMNSASDLQEAFDIVGVLAEVMTGRFKQCEDFVQAAIVTGKSL